MKRSFTLRIILIALAILAAGSVNAQKHIRSVADKIRDNDRAGSSMTNLVKRDPMNRNITSTILQVNVLSPKYARAMARAIDMDEKEALENRKDVSGGVCSQVLRFADQKSRVSVVFTYNVRDYSGASLVYREDFAIQPQKSNNKKGGKRNTSGRFCYEELPELPSICEVAMYPDAGTYGQTSGSEEICMLDEIAYVVTLLP